MKTMTCKQLGGACDEELSAETFEEIAEKAKEHGMKMKDDPAHMKAMQKMVGLMADASAMDTWVAERKAEFDALDDD